MRTPVPGPRLRTLLACSHSTDLASPCDQGFDSQPNGSTGNLETSTRPSGSWWRNFQQSLLADTPTHGGNT
jgi:hypothetical protein